MHLLPRFDLQRSEIDSIHAKFFDNTVDFNHSQKEFIHAIKQGFSSLTECSAIKYAESVYHADILHLEQYFNVVRNDWYYDIQLVIFNKGDKCAKKVIFQRSYKCVEKAMETCCVINRLFGFYDELASKELS